MKEINESRDPDICFHLNSEPDDVCRDCARHTRCTLGYARVFFEGTLPVNSDGEPDLSEFTESFSIPDTPYCCAHCGNEFRSWKRLLDHIREGTV